MVLTNKCKEDFEKWYKGIKNPNGHWYSLVNFNGLVDSMKYGIYVDFFSTIGIEISIKPSKTYNARFEYMIYNEIIDGRSFIVEPLYRNIKNSRQEARSRAIEKANEIYNEKS